MWSPIPSLIPTKKILRTMLRQEFDKGISASQATRNINNTHGEGTIRDRTVYRWYATFSEEKLIEEDNPRLFVRWPSNWLRPQHCCETIGENEQRTKNAWCLLPVNPLRRQQFLDHLCLTKYTEFIAHKCFLCFEHFDPADLLEVNGEKKLRHCQVAPIRLSTALPNPSSRKEADQQDDEDVSDEDEEEEEVIKTEDDKEYTPNTSRASSKQKAREQRKQQALEAQRLEAIKAAKFKGMRHNNVQPMTPLLNGQPPVGPQGRSLKLGRPSNYFLPSPATTAFSRQDGGLVLNSNMSQCFLCSKVISNGVSIPQNSYYRSIWREGLHLHGYLPKAGMICFAHFRLDDLVFDSQGVPCNIKQGVAPVFNSTQLDPKATLESIPKAIAMERRQQLENRQPSEGISRKRKDSSLPSENQEENEEDRAASMQKIAENAEKRKKVLQQGLCGSVIKTFKQVNLDPPPGKQSTCELNEVTNTRFYEPHYHAEDEVYCLSQVTQIGEKICNIENKFTQLMEMVTQFVMAKTNASCPVSASGSGAVAPPISREQYKERQQALSEEMRRKALSEHKRLTKKARRLANTNKLLEEKRRRREERRKHQPFLLYNGIKIYYPTSIRNESTVCKVCFAAFENKVLLADHLYSHDDLSEEYYKCSAVQQHVLESHGEGHGKRYALHNDLPLKTMQILKSYAEKMFGDQGNVIGLDSDSDGQPSSFFEATAKRVKMDRNPNRGGGGGITANVVVREGADSAMDIVQSLFASSNATAIDGGTEGETGEVADGEEEDMLEKSAEVQASNELLDELLSEASMGQQDA
uniref:C2H2-type domain-containing protein n=1 Tax=Ditylenchus dipsaci TaxID=166011 RepID=A0A915EIN9_9BILA